MAGAIGELKDLATDTGSAGKPAVQRFVRERRSSPRVSVDSKVQMVLTGSGISMPGRVLTLSLSGCRIRTDERYLAGIFVRVEIEFNLNGIPFRIGGVSQVIVDPNTIGVRFLDISERRRNQLTELIGELAPDHDAY